MGYVFKYQVIRFLFSLIPSADTRSKLLKKTHFFYEMGENVHFQPRKPPADPKFIKLHNNIAIASNVGFVTHDIIHKVLNHLPVTEITPENGYGSHLGCIEIMDNIFIGSGTRIMPNVKIGPNAIVASGAVVTKDVPPNCVVAGVPARVIGNFDDFVKKRAEENQIPFDKNRLNRVESEWEKFYSSREQNKDEV